LPTDIIRVIEYGRMKWVGAEEKCMRVLVGKPEDQDVDERIILKRIFRK
jgi:hypothetical protein